MSHPERKLNARLPVSAACAMAAVLSLASMGASRTVAGAKTRGAALPPAGAYALDPPHTFATFAAQHLVVGMVRGRFDKISGTVTASSDPAACGLDVSIETASVSTQNSIRDEDLRSARFFDAAKFPAMEYHGRGIRRSGHGWVMEGALTIRGVTKTVPLTFEFRGVAPVQAGKPPRVAFHASAAVKRADFGMTAELLDEIGSVSARADVWIEIDAEALASASPK